MSFKIVPEVFEKLPELYIGAVVIRGVDNKKSYPEIDRMLDEAIENAAKLLEGKKAKEYENVLPYRDTFTELGMNPNKFMPSIEALLTRISKGKGMPHINPVVDLGNAISLKYMLPLGAHTIAEEDEEVRFAREGDIFTPFGADEAESPDVGELIYACSNRVGTRRWIWRQSKEGMITEDSSDIFYPIDGFTSNKEQVDKALAELAEAAERIFGIKPCAVGVSSKDSPTVEF